MCNATEITATRSLNAQLFFVCHATYKAFYKKIHLLRLLPVHSIPRAYMRYSWPFHWHSSSLTWNRGDGSNSPPLTHGDQIPHPLEDSDNQIPSSPGWQMCHARGGGDVEASIWPILKYEEIITPLADYESRCLRKRNYQVIQKRNTIFEWIVKGLYLIKINRQNISYLIGHYRLIDWVFDDRSRSICYVMKYVIPLLIRRNWMMYLLPSHQQYTIFCRLDWFLSFWATSTALQSKSIPCVVRVL